MDSVIIFPPGPSVAGSQLQIGTYIMYDPGPDFGAEGLIHSMESSNALRDGGAFGFRSVGPRHMAFPLLLRDVSGQTLLQTESLLRNWTTPGGAVAIQPEGVPSGEAVFFDVLDGRWEPDYSPFENRAGRRRGTLHLDTQPWGYWPTEMLLASAASIGWMGAMPVNGASIIGDAPPLAHVLIQPTSASAYPPTGSWFADMVAWSFAGNPSFRPLIGATNFVFTASPPPWGQGASGWFAASLANDKYAPASQAWVITPSTGLIGPAVNPNLMPWTQLFSSSQGAIPSALEPAYRGRFRVFAFTRTTPSEYPWNMMVDAIPAGGLQALATANQLATMMQPVMPSSLLPLTVSSYWTASLFAQAATMFIASPGYQIVDCGEITLPPAGSGFQGPVDLRVWMAQGPSGANAEIPATNMQVYFGGLSLLPVDGAAGILTGGLAYPSVAAYSPTVNVPSTNVAGTQWNLIGASPASMMQGAFEMGAQFQETFLITRPGASQVLSDARAAYRGIAPRLGASTNQLTLLLGDKRAGVPSAPFMNANLEFAQVSVSYRPSFQFLHGI